MGRDRTARELSWEAGAPQQPIAQLRRYVQELFAYHYADRETSGRVRGSLLANLALELGGRDPEVADRLAEFFRRETAAFTLLLIEAATRGEASLAHPSRAAESLVACLHGLVMLAKVRNDLDVLPENESALLRLAGVVQNQSNR